MKLLAAALAVTVCSLSGTDGKVGALLQVAEGQDGGVRPYRSAKLTIRNNSAVVIRAATLRWQQGGPTVLQPLTVAPEAEQTVSIALPAMSQQQTYVIRLLQGDEVGAAEVGTVTAEINWPAELVTDEAFLAGEDCRAWAEERPTWPQRLLRTVFAAAVLGCIVLGGVLFIRPPAARAIVLILSAAAFGVGLAMLLGPEPIVVQRVVPQHSLMVVGCRRTATWKHGDAGAVPLYLDQEQLLRETMLVRPGRGLRVTLDPRETRLFRVKADSTATASGD